MTRLAAAMRGDVVLQYRQGFYWAATFVVAVMVLVLRSIPAEPLPWLLPVLVLGNIQINAFYFVGGLVLLEKTEGTLESVAVTPLRPWEYLASKVGTLTALSLAENFVLALLVVGRGVRPGPFALGIVLGSAVFTLAGFLVVIRYDSINEYLMPSFVWVTLLSLPLLPYFGLVNGRLFLLHPISPALAALRAGFEPHAAWFWIWAPLCAGAWLAALQLLCRRGFLGFVAAGAGARRR